jgi:hypothetical protein
MKFFTTLVTPAMVCIHQALANTVNYLIWDPNANDTRVSLFFGSDVVNFQSSTKNSP